MAHADIRVNPRTWIGPGNEERQARWIELMLELLVAKQRVAGVFLPHFSDAGSHRFPHAGVLRENGTSKEVVERLIAQRLNHRRKI